MKNFLKKIKENFKYIIDIFFNFIKYLINKSKKDYQKN